MSLFIASFIINQIPHLMRLGSVNLRHPEPQAQSSALTVLMMLLPWVMGSLNHVDPLDYYLACSNHACIADVTSMKTNNYFWEKYEC